MIDTMVTDCWTQPWDSCAALAPVNGVWTSRTATGNDCRSLYRESNIGVYEVLLKSLAKNRCPQSQAWSHLLIHRWELLTFCETICYPRPSLPLPVNTSRNLLSLQDNRCYQIFQGKISSAFQQLSLRGECFCTWSSTDLCVFNAKE